MIHDDLVSAVWPGVDPVASGEYRDLRLLESAAGRPFQTMGGVDLYQGIFEKGAALFHSLIANHPFHNGNKRTAVLAVDLFFSANGWSLDLSDEEMTQLARDTASYRERGVSHEEIVRRIVAVFKGNALSFRAAKKHFGESRYYKSLLENRGLTRSHPLNKHQLYSS